MLRLGIPVVCERSLGGDRLALHVLRILEVHGRLGLHDGLRVLHTWGTPQERGYAHGFLLGNDIAAIDAAYRPTFTSNLGVRSATTFSRSQTTGASASGLLSTETLTGNTGLSQNLRWGGGNFALSFNNNRLSQSDLFAIRNPTLNTSFNAVMVQIGRAHV